MRLFTSLLLLLALNASGQFTGQAGVYYLGAADIPVSATNYSDSGISGVVCRFRWETVEPFPGNYSWTFVDGEIQKAQAAGKKISLQPLGYPAWIIDSLNAQPFYYIDENPNHPTYGQVVSGVLPWDSIYISRVKALMQELSVKYSADTTVSYLNLIGAQVSRNLPDTVITDTTLLIEQPFWVAFSYNADTLAPVINDLTDTYMNLFPNTPVWCSVDYVKFEFNASARPINYLATLYTSYGLANYPDRFGLFREDLSGCNPPANVSPGSHWYIMQQNPCATGAQMLWNVQDGPDRMNQCNMVPNTESFVLDSAIQHGLTLGMRYMEIYGADIVDSSLKAGIAAANNALHQKSANCLNTTIQQFASSEDFVFWPNPVSGKINFTIHSGGELDLSVFSLDGKMLFSSKVFPDADYTANVHLPSPINNGLYILKIRSGEKTLYRRFVVESNR